MRARTWMAAAAALQIVFVCGCGMNDASAQKNTGTETDTAGEVQAETSGSLLEDAQASQAEGELTVTFLDVGQGNAVLVQSGGEAMLIDGGDREYASFVVSYLKNAGVTELSYVVASHYDADHLNGIVGALHAFPCEEVLAADYVTDTRVYESFCEVIAEQGIEPVYPGAGEVYEIGDASFTVVCPDSYDYADANDNSVGIRLVHGANSFLICGDAGEASEEAMLQSGVVLDSDVYLASHHGSDTSSSAAFLKAVSPEAVVISVGEDNQYGHPSARVLDDAAAVGAEIYRTDLQGTITVTSDGEHLFWSTEPAAETEQSVSGGQAASGGAEQAPALLEGDGQGIYILNQNTKKFHLPSCSSVKDINSENRAEFQGTRDELTGAGYEPCQRCKP